MKKLFGIFIVVGLILMLIGISLDTSLFRTAMGNQSNNYKTINKSFASNEIEQIVIDSRNAGIRVKPSDNDEISISYRENNNLKYNLTLENEVLTLEQERRDNNIRFGLMNFNRGDKYTIILNIPKDSIDSLKVGSTNGAILLQDVEIAMIDIRTTNAVIEIKNVVATNIINMGTTNGLIEFDNVNTGDLSARTTNGLIEFSRLRANNIQMETTNGLIEGNIIGNRDDYEKNMGTTNGRIRIDGQNYGNTVRGRSNLDKELEMRTTNGNITINFR